MKEEPRQTIMTDCTEEELAEGLADYLSKPDAALVPCEVFASEDGGGLWLELRTEGLAEAATLKSRDLRDRLRFLMAARELENARGDYSFSLAPENLMFDANMRPRAKDRGRASSDGDFPREYKALVGAALSGGDFEGWLRGGDELLAKSGGTCAAVAEADGPDAVRDALASALAELDARLASDSVMTSRKKLRRLKASLPIPIVIAALLLAFCVKLWFFDIPEKNLSIEVSDKYLAKDYVGLLAALGDADVSKLSDEERYMAAYAGFATSNLSQEQKDVVGRTVTLDTDSLYLDYWVYVGLADYDSALDISKRLGDSELEAQALILLRDQTDADMNMDGNAKAEKLKELDARISEIEEAKTESENAAAGGAAK